MKCQLICPILALCLVVVMAVPSVAAASFDLLLKGHWAYADLALLADAQLLEEYRSAKELRAVFPLTRYEVALLVGEVLTSVAQDSEQHIMSSDNLMWRILENSSGSEEGELDLERVARARLDSESAFQIIARLAEEFRNELKTLGIPEVGIAGPASPKVDTRSGDQPIVTVRETSNDIHDRAERLLASLGVTQLISTTSLSWAGENSFTLPSNLKVEVAALGGSLWQNDADAASGKHGFDTEPERNVEVAWEQPLGAPRNMYAPVDVIALFDQSIENKSQGSGSSCESEVQVPEAEALKLLPHMSTSRPTGLLTSYFLDRTND